MLPDWLPPQLVFSGNSLQNDYDVLHATFQNDFLSGDVLEVDNLTIFTDTSIDPNSTQGYTRGFTHLVTIGSQGRAIDYDRAKKLPWVRAVIENHFEAEVNTFWTNSPKGPTLYLWLADYDFVVILRRMKGSTHSSSGIIITAYHVQSYGRRDLQKLYGKAIRIL